MAGFVFVAQKRGARAYRKPLGEITLATSALYCSKGEIGGPARGSCLQKEEGKELPPTYHRLNSLLQLFALYSSRERTGVPARGSKHDKKCKQQTFFQPKYLSELKNSPKYCNYKSEISKLKP